MSNKLVKKVVTLALAATLALGSVMTVAAETASTTTETPAAPVSQKKAAATNGSTVNTSKKGTATLTSVKKTTKTSVKVASTVKVGDVKYTVTTIGANAFKKASKAKTITLPNTVKTISASAFTGAKKLTKVNLTLKSGKTVSVSKNAFKGLSKSQKSKIKVTINYTKMSKKQISSLKKALKSAGIKTSNIKFVKAKKTTKK